MICYHLQPKKCYIDVFLQKDIMVFEKFFIKNKDRVAFGQPCVRYDLCDMMSRVKVLVVEGTVTRSFFDVFVINMFF